jgi:hypothetical protein
MLVFLVGMVVTCLVFPGMVIAEVSSRHELTRGQRVALIVGLVIFGPLVAAPYAFRSGAKLRHRVLAIAFALFIPLSLFGLKQFNSITTTMASDTLSYVEVVVSAGSLPQETRSSVLQAIQILKAQMESNSWYSIEQTARLTALSQSLAFAADDESFSAEEAREWLRLFENRESMSTLQLQLGAMSLRP